MKLAALQRATTFAWAAAAVLGAAACFATGRVAGGAAVLLLAPWIAAPVLAAEMVAMRRANRLDPSGPPALADCVRAWAAEIVYGLATFTWRQPFRSRALPDHLPQPTAAAPRPGVLLVHGLLCNRGFWNPWLRALRARDVAFVAVDLEPVFGSIDDYVAILDAAHARLLAATGSAPLVVAHSMGGLAVRRWLADSAAPPTPRHIVTIGTPHRGTPMARLGWMTNTVQMRRGSAWLRRLEADEAPAGAAAYAGFTCFHGPCDNIVFPTATATLPGADNRLLPACAHVQMAFHPAVFGEVLRRLGAGPG